MGVFLSPCQITEWVFVRVSQVHFWRKPWSPLLRSVSQPEQPEPGLADSYLSGPDALHL